VLRRDPAFRLIPPDAYSNYIERSLTIGRCVAAEYVGRDPGELASGLGARVVYSDSQHEVAGCIVRSEYDSGKRAITVYTPSIAEIEQLLADTSIPSMLTRCSGRTRLNSSSIAQIHIAHELFHHLEATQIGCTDERLPPVVFRRLGRIRIGLRRVRGCREIAAHMFAKELLNLPFLPNLIDISAQL
jgi:hypothetical protein